MKKTLKLTSKIFEEMSKKLGKNKNELKTSEECLKQLKKCYRPDVTKTKRKNFDQLIKQLENVLENVKIIIEHHGSYKVDVEGTPKIRKPKMTGYLIENKFDHCIKKMSKNPKYDKKLYDLVIILSVSFLNKSFFQKKNSGL